MSNKVRKTSNKKDKDVRLLKKHYRKIYLVNQHIFSLQRTFIAIVAFCLVLTIQNSEAKREVLKKIFSYLDFDARDVKSPSAIAPLSPVVVVPQYRSTDPIYLQPLSNPVPQVTSLIFINHSK